MNNYYRFSVSGFANCDKIVAVDVNSESDKEHLKRLHDCLAGINGAWIDKYRLRDVQDMFAYRSKCRREGVGDSPIGATSITPIADYMDDYSELLRRMDVMNNFEIWASPNFCVDNGYDWFNATDRRDWDNWSVEACRADLAHAGQPTDDKTVLVVYRVMLDIIAEYDAFNQ